MRNNNHAIIGRQLKIAVVITAVILLAELAGGYLANSLALLSDAGHVFTDILALLLSWFGAKQAERPPDGRMTYGYHRISILIAVINALSLVVISLVIFYEAYQRLQSPEPVESVLMFAVAALGLGANVLVMVMLAAYQKGSLNVRSAFLHVAGDALASVGVIVGGAIIYFTDWFWVDPAISVFIGLIIVVGSWTIVKEGIGIFLEISPGHLEVEEVANAMLQVPGVKNVHDLHIWSIAHNMHALSSHVLVNNLTISESAFILEQLNEVLTHRFNIGHSTFQLECVACDPNALYCSYNGEFQAEIHTHHH